MCFGGIVGMRFKRKFSIACGVAFTNNAGNEFFEVLRIEKGRRTAAQVQFSYFRPAA
ncbi:hypothetical protein D3C85_916230 [compost metagenome]